MKLHHALIAGVAVAMIAGCADYGDYYADEGYYGPAAYGPVADIAYDGWYDGYYGPIFDGYWDNDIFYYRTADSGPFLRGDTAHFRHDPAPGFTHIQGMARARTTTAAPMRRPPPTH